MSTSRPSQQKWNMQNMLAWLQHVQQQAKHSHGDNAAYVHQNPITYVSDKQKGQWTVDPNDEASEDRHTIQKLGKIPKDNAKTWIAYCNTPNEAYPRKRLTDAEKAVPADHPTRKRQWHKVGRHAFILVLTSPPSGGKNLYMFDCDQKLGPGKDVKGLVCQTARVFIQKMNSKSMSMNIKRVFFGNRGRKYSGKNKCQYEATRFLEEIAGKSGEAVEHEDDDRFDGFVEFSMVGGR